MQPVYQRGRFWGRITQGVATLALGYALYILE